MCAKFVAVTLNKNQYNKMERKRRFLNIFASENLMNLTVDCTTFERSFRDSAGLNRDWTRDDNRETRGPR